jgi:hypothetical protein
LAWRWVAIEKVGNAKGRSGVEVSEDRARAEVSDKRGGDKLATCLN